MPRSSSSKQRPDVSAANPALPGDAQRPGVNASDLLSRIWEQHLPLTRERVATLRRCGADAQLGPLQEKQRIEAADIAHKLAGSLGMFGFPRGTELAREIETLLETGQITGGLELARLAEELYITLPL